MKVTSLPARAKEGHKGTFGTVAVFAGHISDKSVMLGSAVFAAKAAIKSGVGLIDFFGDKQTLVQLIKMFPQAVGHTFESFEEQSSNWKAVVVGPGWAATDRNIEMLKNILKLDVPTVIDGEALNIMAADRTILNLLHAKCVLTPHLKEFDRLSKGAKIDDPETFANQYGGVLVLKSSVTKVFSAGRAWKFEGNNPVLATGGSGDVLAGLIAGYAAQYYPEIDLSTCSLEAVKTHAKAGEKYKRQKGDRGLIIDELVDLI